MFIEVKNLVGASLSAAGKSWVIEGFLFDAATWITRYVVIREQVVAPFSTSMPGGTAAKQFVILASLLRVDREGLKLSAEFERLDLSRHPLCPHLPDLGAEEERGLVEAFQYPRYWETDEAGESSLLGDRARVVSSVRFQGLLIESVTGYLGRIEDLVIEAESLALKYFVVTTDLTHPQQVLVDPEWIESISWETRTLVLNDISKEAIFLEASVNPKAVGDQRYQIEV